MCFQQKDRCIKLQTFFMVKRDLSNLCIVRNHISLLSPGQIFKNRTGGCLTPNRDSEGRYGSLRYSSLQTALHSCFQSFVSQV